MKDANPMPQMQTDVDKLAEALTGALPELDLVDQRIAIVIYRLLARGRPASLHEIATASSVSRAEVERRLTPWPAVFQDADGNVVGFWGLTIAEMPPHRLEVSGNIVWAWCAWDTLFLPARLGAVAEVRSVCPVTKQGIELRVAPDRIERVHPAEVAVSFLSPERRFDGDVITTFCHFIHFFASQQAGEEWTAVHPGTFLLSLADAFELARRYNRQFEGAIA